MSLARQALALGMRCTSISLRNKWHALLACLLQRLHAAAAAARGRARVRLAGGSYGKHIKKQLAIDNPQADAAGKRPHELIDLSVPFFKRGHAFQNHLSEANRNLAFLDLKGYDGGNSCSPYLNQLTVPRLWLLSTVR